jgi:hypothetical protein
MARFFARELLFGGGDPYRPAGVSSRQQKERPMSKQDHDIGKNQKDSDKGRPDKGGTAGQSGGEEAKNRSSNPDSVKD